MTSKSTAPRCSIWSKSCLLRSRAQGAKMLDTEFAKGVLAVLVHLLIWLPLIGLGFAVERLWPLRTPETPAYTAQASGREPAGSGSV
jgi:hypothetical protein